MQTNRKKGFLHATMTIALAASIIQCAWACFADNQKLALDANGISVVGENAGVNSNTEEEETYVIDASSPEAISVPSSTRLTGNIQIASDGKKVSLSLRNADVIQVLRMFADKANLNIVFHNSARGYVTLDLKDVSINTALEFVLDACELTYVKQDNNIIVASKAGAKELSYARQNFITLPVKYVNAQSIADFLNANVFNGKYQGVSSEPIVAVNANKNELMIFGTDQDEALASKILEKLDVKPMMNVFPVNHISPQEMASTICDTILSDKSEGGSDQGVTVNTEQRSSSSSEDEITLGGGYAVCVVGEQNGTINKDESLSGDLENYVSNPLTVAFFPELGTVATYGGSREQVKMIESFIKLHEKKQPMAYIELSMIQLSETGSKQFNNEWRIWSPIGSFQFDSAGFQTNPWNPTFFNGEQWTYVDENGEPQYTINRYHGWGPIVLQLSYLIQNGKGRVLASPKVMVTNGQKSVIDLTSDYVKSIREEFNNTGLAPISNRIYEIASDQGIKVEITPFISPDGYVVMNLKPDYSTIRETAAGGEYTLLTRRNLELNNVRVKDGETLVLAGLIQEDERQSVLKIPILGDLPIVGAFFRQSQNTISKEELVILITPHIVYSKEQIDSIKQKSAMENL